MAKVNNIPGLDNATIISKNQKKKLKKKESKINGTKRIDDLRTSDFLLNPGRKAASLPSLDTDFVFSDDDSRSEDDGKDDAEPDDDTRTPLKLNSLLESKINESAEDVKNKRDRTSPGEMKEGKKQRQFEVSQLV